MDPNQSGRASYWMATTALSTLPDLLGALCQLHLDVQALDSLLQDLNSCCIVQPSGSERPQHMKSCLSHSTRHHISAQRTSIVPGTVQLSVTMICVGQAGRLFKGYQTEA